MTFTEFPDDESIVVFEPSVGAANVGDNVGVVGLMRVDVAAVFVVAFALHQTSLKAKSVDGNTNNNEQIHTRTNAPRANSA